MEKTAKQNKTVNKRKFNKSKMTIDKTMEKRKKIGSQKQRKISKNKGIILNGKDAVRGGELLMFYVEFSLIIVDENNDHIVNVNDDIGF